MNFSEFELGGLADLLAEVARREIMPRFARIASVPVRMKSGPLDPVTEADEAAETAITAELRRRFPAAVVVGEEAAEADQALLAAVAKGELAFTVDPIDGTANFAAGLPLFGVMLGVLVRGEVVAGIIHDPVTNETALARRGGGAWMQGGQGRRELRVAAGDVPGRMTGSVSWRYFPSPRRETICRNLPRLAANWDYRCAAHQYRLAAAGFCHFLLFHRLMPWDHVPGWLLHREAGGYSAHLDGTPYDPANFSGGLLVAPDAPSWGALRAALLEGEGTQIDGSRRAQLPSISA